MPSSRLGPTDKYDGDAQKRKSSAGVLQLGAALRLFPFASSFAVLKKDRFCSFHLLHVQWLKKRHVRLEFSFHFSDVDHLCVHSSTRSWLCHVGFHLFPCRVGYQEGTRPDKAASVCVPRGFFPVSGLCAGRLPAKIVQPPANCLFHLRNCRFNEMSLCRACRCFSEQSPRCPYVSQNFPICSHCVACSDTSLSRRVESFFCASISFMQSTQSAQCASGVGSSRNASNLDFALSEELSNARPTNRDHD